jgi:signal peptidase II
MRYLITVILAVAADQLSKLWIVSHMQLHESIPVWGIFHITYIQNTGAAFSMMSGRQQILLLIAVLVLLALFYLCWKTPKERCWERFCYALISAGAIGNVIDRLRLGYVVDFFDFTFFPVFNIADICINVGVFLLLGILLVREIKARREKKDQA